MLGLNLDVGSLVKNLPGIGQLFGGPDDPYGDWLKQQLYNSPVEQMKRLQDAGLNPNLIYANGVSNTATSAIRARDGGIKLGLGFNADSANADIMRKIYEKQLSMLDDREESLTLQNQKQKIQNDILQKTLDFYNNTGSNPGQHPMERLGLSLFNRVMEYDNETGYLSSGALQFFEFMNNIFGYFKDPRNGWYQPTEVKHKN